MTRTKLLDAMLAKQENRISRARRMARLADRATYLANLRSLERASLSVDWTPGSIERFLTRSAQLARSAFRHTDRALRLNRLAQDQLTETR